MWGKKNFVILNQEIYLLIEEDEGGVFEIYKKNYKEMKKKRK